MTDRPTNQPTDGNKRSLPITIIQLNYVVHNLLLTTCRCERAVGVHPGDRHQCRGGRRQHPLLPRPQVVQEEEYGNK